MALLPPDPANYDFPQVFTFASNILALLTDFAGIIATLMFIIGAITYISGSTTGDKDNKAAKGKLTIYWAVAGIVIILLSRLVLQQFFVVINPNQSLLAPSLTNYPELQGIFPTPTEQNEN